MNDHPIVQWLRRQRLWLIAVGFVALLGYTWWAESRPAPAAEQGVLQELRAVGDLRAQFNADAGRPRLILLLAPT